MGLGNVEDAVIGAEATALEDRLRTLLPNADLAEHVALGRDRRGGGKEHRDDQGGYGVGHDRGQSQHDRGDGRRAGEDSEHRTAAEQPGAALPRLLLTVISAWASVSSSRTSRVT
ncbi:hypothetical protein NKG94_00085 [Micromonospora sp. M12]